MNNKLIVGLAASVVGLLLLVIMMPFTVIDPGERGVIMRFGQINRIVDSGIHWVTPIAEDVEKMDVTTRLVEVGAAAASKDLQNVHSTVAVNYNLVADKVDRLWAMFRGSQDEVAIAPAVQEAVKAATAKYTAEELITKREQVKNDIQVILTERLAQVFINVSQVAITDFDFSNEFNASIEAKVTAEQQALTAKNKLEQVRYEAEQRITQAKGEAEAIRIQAQAITQQGGKDYVQLKAIEKWDGKLPAQFVPGSAIPFLNISALRE